MMSTPINADKKATLGELLAQNEGGSYPLEFNIDDKCIITVPGPNPKVLTIEECYKDTKNVIVKTGNKKTVSYDANATCGNLLADILTTWNGERITANVGAAYLRYIERSSEGWIANEESNEDYHALSYNNGNIKLESNTTNANENEMLDDNNNFNSNNITNNQNSNLIDDVYYDYTNPIVVADRIDVHGKKLAEKAFNFWRYNVQGIQPGDQMSKDIPINTTHHGKLRYTVTISKDQQGNATIKIHGSSADEGLNSIGRNTCYANMITRDARHKLLAAGHNVDVSDDVKLTKDQAYQDNYFTDLEQAIRGAPGTNETMSIKDAQNDPGAHSEIYKIANVDDVITKIKIPELKADLEYMKSIGCTRFVVWKMPNSDFVRFDGMFDTGGFIDFFDVIGYEVDRLNLQPEVQYVQEPQIEYVEQPQIEYVDEPRAGERTTQIQINAYPQAQPQHYQVPMSSYNQGEGRDQLGETEEEEEDEEEMVFNGPAPIRTMQTTREPQLGILHRQYMRPRIEEKQEDEFNDEEMDDLDENVTEEIPVPPREFNVKIRPREGASNDGPKERESTQNIFNIKTVEGVNSTPGTATQNIKPAETATKPEIQGSVTDLRQPVVVLGNPGQVMASPNSAPAAKGEEVRVDINHDPIKEETKVHIEHDPIVENSKIVIDHQDILDELKALVEQQGRNQSQALKDVIDNIKVEIEHEPVASQQIKLYEKLLIEMEQLKEKTNIDIDINDDDLRQEIAELRKQISGLKGDNISIELNHLEDVNQKLELIAEKLNGIQNSNDAIQVVIDANDEMQRLKEERNDIIEISPDLQELSDKITVLIDNKMQGLNINDKLEIHQPDINIEQPEIVVEQPDLSELTKSVDELKGLIAKVEDNVKIQIEQKMKELQEQDVQVIIQEEPKEIIVDKPTKKEENQIVVTNEFVEKKPDVNKEITVTNEFETMEPQDKEIVIEIPAEVEPKNEQVEVVNEFKNMEPKVDNVMVTNEFEKVEPKVEETQIVNEFEPVEPKKQTEIVQEYEVNRAPVIAQGPIPMQGFMAAPMMPMMMPPVFMPPPMPMPAPQPQQPIIITQNQSDEEEGNSFWSNFWKILLILLLIASLIGVGLLLWKNMQKTNDRANDQKPDKKPEPDKKPDPKPEPEKAEEITIKPDKPVDQGPIKTDEGQVAQPVCEDGKNLQLNVNAEKVSLGADTGALTSDAKNAINLENAGTHNKLIAADGTTIDTRRIEITGNQISARDWNGSLSNAKTYTGTIQDGQAVINGKTYTIANESGQAYSSGAIDVASQTSYTRNSDQTLSTNFGTLKQDLQINKNNTFTLNTNTENGTTISSNTVDDISNNATMQDILKNKLNDSNLTKGEYNRIMDALDNGKLDDSYFQTINNGTTGYSLDNSNNIGNGAGY